MRGRLYALMNSLALPLYIGLCIGLIAADVALLLGVKP